MQDITRWNERDGDRSMIEQLKQFQDCMTFQVTNEDGPWHPSAPSYRWLPSRSCTPAMPPLVLYITRFYPYTFIAGICRDTHA